MIILKSIIIVILLTLTAHTTYAVEKGVAATRTDRQKFKAGRAKAQGCTRCHGRKGIQQLAQAAGWTEDVGAFAQKSLTEFRDGKRVNNVMAGVTKNLTDQDIKDISYWLNAIAKK